MNVVMLVGNLTRDPEMKYTSGGKAVTEFTVAVNEGTGEKRVTTFIKCEAWEETAEQVAERARKGSRVAVEGRLKVDTWNDKVTNARREKMFVTARTVNVLPSAPALTELTPEARPNVPQRAPQPQPEEEENFDDLPF
jgi:single-strand DNA-binding protein